MDMYRMAEEKNLAFVPADRIPVEEKMKRAALNYGHKVRRAFKDLNEAIEELRLVALATGYRHDDLVTILKEDVDDGIFSLEECFEHVRDVSLEYDW